MTSVPQARTLKAAELKARAEYLCKWEQRHRQANDITSEPTFKRNWRSQNKEGL